MKIGMVSLGCPKNLVDSEVMLGLIREKQLEITNDPAEADLIIVNTCGFIESAKEESIETILDLNWLRTNRSLKGIVVTGCMAQRYFEEIKNESIKSKIEKSNIIKETEKEDNNNNTSSRKWGVFWDETYKLPYYFNFL